MVFASIIKKGTNYDYITVHFLRHANATLLLMNDVDLKTVSAHLGHSDISITADIYADVLHFKQKYVAQLIEFNLEDDD
ncbi:tyrosine-type recombinase/integrase [Sharpea azabuensis]|uniref:tyrosine-type recombinase/integrase n=1 Tax=Sharpea azabuensis TaxID=322505 RepID=UPI0009F6D675|nr:tyrosine-type recombinase/integrase [Sharpea azabuensis]